MTTFPTLVEPPGDPVGVKAVASRLSEAAAGLGETSRSLADANQQTTQVWDGQAQRIFSLLAEGFSGVISGSGGIAEQFSAALHRYADVLAACQDQVRNARQRLQALAASTPAGMVPDPAAVSALTSQADNARATVAQAGRELSTTAIDLMGAPADIGLEHGADVNASFVSRTHTSAGGSVNTAPAAFDAQAAHLQQQFASVMAGLAGMVTTSGTRNAGLYPSVALVGGSSFSSDIHGPDTGLLGPMIIGGGQAAPTFSTSSDIHELMGPAIVGGGMRNDNPALVLAQAVENRHTAAATQIWESAFPGTAPPSGHSGQILREILDRAPSLTPSELAAIGVVNDGINYNIRSTLLPPGWELVREPRYF